MTTVKHVRKGWLEAFNQLADDGGDDLLLSDSSTSFDEDDWSM